MTIRYWQSCLLLVWLWPIWCLAQTVSLSISHHQAIWNIHLSGTDASKVHSFNLSDPKRIVIDVNGADHFKSAISPAALEGTPIKKIRSAVTAPHKIRIVLDLQPHISPELFKISFSSPGLTSKASSGKPQPIPVATLLPATRPREVIVVIDPGHGGKDPGAIGLKKTQEKDIVLSISKKLQSIINHQPGFKAILTRNGDYYLTLRERLAIARKHKADIFIAIHADAYPDPLAQGVSIFALSQRGATSEAARWLADRENQSELRGGVDLNDKGDVLRSVLINLSQITTIRTSLIVGQNMLENIRRFSRLHHRQVEQAAFVVLKSPDIPSLLIETGFLSNANEEEKLKSTRYQYNLAHAIMLGIKQYFIRFPPPGTWLATQEKHTKTEQVV